MNRNYFLIIALAALACLFLIFFTLWRDIEAPSVKEPAIIPPAAPYKSYIAGVGIVEASSENRFIGSPLTRMVDKVLVNVGDKVKKGDDLIYLENRDLKAELLAQQDAYKIALAKLHKLESAPRAEDVSIAEAALNSAKADYELAKNQNDMVQRLQDSRGISQQERNRRLYQYQQAEAKLNQARADFDKIKAGTWKPDLEIARLEVQQAQANILRIKTEIQRTIIQSPIDGTILQVKVHAGEFPPPNPFQTPMMILGNTDELYLRVSINQLDVPNFQSMAHSVAYLQGDAQTEFPLEFIRIEPFLVNKENLTNQLTEKVDTRVLQIIYRIKDNGHPLYVGQQMDAFIEAEYPS